MSKKRICNKIEENDPVQATKICRILGPNGEKSPDSELVVAANDDVSGSTNRKILQVAMLFFESSSDSESDDDVETTKCILKARKALNTHFELLKEHKIFREKASRNCIKKYVEDVIPSYTEVEFRRHFRISRSLYNNICASFGKSKEYTCQRIDKRLSANLYVAVFFWFAGHEACSYRDLADRFDLSLGTVWNIIRRVSFYISSLSPGIIKWPNETKKIMAATYFAEKCNFSKAIGCIDGTHVVIDPPKNSKDDYIDRKGNTSLCLQGICDENKKFISIFVGYPGSSHDSWVFQNSPLYSKLSTICGDYYLLGDSAYPCCSQLVTPYRDNGHLTRGQKTFNMKLSSGRVIIEHTFGMLKQRFRQLYYCKIRGIKHLCHFIRACCVLHNIANEDDIPFNFDAVPEGPEDTFDSGQNIRGNAVRDAIRQEIEN